MNGPAPDGYRWLSKEPVIAGVALAAIATHLVLRFALDTGGTLLGFPTPAVPLLAALTVGGIPLVAGLVLRLVRLDFGSDLLAGISIVTAAVLGEYLAGTLVVLMLSGGQALEAYAVRRASSALLALARRMPSRAHRKRDGQVAEIALAEVVVGDLLVVFPHETCPVDAVVVEGHTTMDESYLTGEPYVLSKVVGSGVLSGAINGEGALTIRAEKTAVDSRYAKIMQVMRESEQRRPALRRLGDQLGAVYTPVAVAVALVAWAASGDALRFLAVLVVATPCPLLIGIPVAIIGSVSLAARRGIIIKDPAVLEKIDTCRTAIFDKTGTLTYGRPELTDVLPGEGFTKEDVLGAVASLERYSRHPLAAATVAAADDAGLAPAAAAEVSERPGEGLRGTIGGRAVQVTSRKKLVAQLPASAGLLPPLAGGLECVALIDGRYAATFRYRDEPRAEGKAFIGHLKPHHGFERVMLVSGDRESEVRYLAEKVGITEVHAGQSPEQKLALVREESRKAGTVFMGDGINDSPALTAATVGIAFGQGSDVTAEAAGAVILESSLERVDELLHIGKRMRAIALQTAIGGMALSLIGMVVAAAGYLPPVAGAVTQEVIDVLAVLNALRASLTPRVLTDYAS
ncbi:heavy metal translocating P-type ATPase [Urbifossiella limnaea]|uniref:P-type Zn(2+) transporter n=1 Tax=Urbifossiella limnaea TaxID=2528023 RepID=A0A517Y285_9BACT|nr:heavy metal translocating P-type ATPase [Urbifossiella limnaea]QDU23844.1 Copper-transporting P-type ATPase [Urbifossiella limnaea]